MIEGWADHTYAAKGDAVGLYVSTTAPRFHVVAYRMGYYQGKGAREVWQSPEVEGQLQPPCPLDTSTNMVACDNWTKSLTMAVTSAFVQGDYVLKMVGSDNEQGYMLLTVWDPASTATYLFMNRTLTEEGWNAFGGYDYYQGIGPCIVDTVPYPVCNRARTVSYDRPYLDGNGASDFFFNEYPLLRQMEKEGLDVAYVSDITVNDHPEIVARHRALLSLGHDETWTYAEREGAETAFGKGTNMLFFGAASVLRHSRLAFSPIGPEREEVDYRNSDEDPLNGSGSPMEVTGNTWASPPSSWPADGWIGEIYSGYVEPGAPSSPFVVLNADAWAFKGTGLRDGSTIPGVIASDIDHIDPADGMPKNIEVLGHSPLPLSTTYTNQGKWNGVTYSDMTYYTDPVGGAGVIDTGTVNWIPALIACPPSVPTGSCGADQVAKVTSNLLWLFGQGPAGKVLPSVPNWQQVTPPGS